MRCDPFHTHTPARPTDPAHTPPQHLPSSAASAQYALLEALQQRARAVTGDASLRLSRASHCSPACLQALAHSSSLGQPCSHEQQLALLQRVARPGAAPRLPAVLHGCAPPARPR
jgi:hypothetical protein